MIVDEDRLVNIDQTCDLIVSHLRLMIDSFSNGSGIYPTTKQTSNTIFQRIDRNKIPFGYIRGIDNSWMVTHILWIKISCDMLSFLWYFFYVRSVPHWFRSTLPDILMFPKVPPYWVRSPISARSKILWMTPCQFYPRPIHPMHQIGVNNWNL